MSKRIGIVGFGFVGQYIYEQIGNGKDPDLEVAFVWNRSPACLEELPTDLILRDPGEYRKHSPDLVIEMCHPDISRNYGKRFLSDTDYLMMSVTAMADAELATDLIAAAEHSGHSLFIPHGALVGVENMLDGRGNWSEVTITFRKHPNSLDFSESGIDPESITAETLIFEGSVREIAQKFPRNVNTMATCALAGVGFDETRAMLIADPTMSSMSAEMIALGKDGGRLETRKVEPAAGVSGTGMLSAQLGSIRRACLGGRPGINFV